jgi:uncharacterized protein (TIGR02996 family)
MRKFVYQDARSHKFWNIELSGTSYTVTYGKVGTDGAVATKTFADEATARKEHDKLVAQKLKKGYVEQAIPAQPDAMRDALEAALVADPDDLASHMAYADWLHEHGDLRGRFIQIQLALENAAQSARERKALQAQEDELLVGHREAWLGDLAGPLDHPPEADYSPLRVELTFVRGWVQRLSLNNYRVLQTRALARAPELRLLRELVLIKQAFEDADEWEPGDDIPAGTYEAQLYPLLRADNLANVRTFTLGAVGGDKDDSPPCRTHGEVAAELVKKMPRLEELRLLAQYVDTDTLFVLPTLDNLRILQVYHCHEYPLAKLAANPALSRLTTLLCHPHALDPAYDRSEGPYLRLDGVRALVHSKHLPSLAHLQLRCADMGDEGAREIVGSGILKRLKTLDLRHGNISDAGARLLADCPDVRNLERLDLTNNCLTSEGIEALAGVVPGLVADDQWEPNGDEENDQEYLYQGDIE